MRKILSALAVAALALFGGQPSKAANSWNIGMNNLFIQNYLHAQLGANWCATGLMCPRGQDVTSSAVSTALLSWGAAATGHMGSYREIVGMNWMAPTCASSTCVDTTYYSYIDTIVDIYKAYNLTLILALGTPVPAWADSWATNKNGQCFMPIASDSTNWATAKDHLAWALGNYYAHYVNRGSAYKTWAESHIVLEPLNEFDAGYANSATCGTDHTTGTPARNSDLTGGVNYVVTTFYGLTANMSAASMVGVYNGVLHNTGYTHMAANYWADFYYYGGGGAANSHIYLGADITGGTESGIKSLMEPLSTEICTAIGSTNCQYMIMGETGWSQRASNCTSSDPNYNQSLADSVRNTLYADLAADTTLQSSYLYFLYWDSQQYAFPTDCVGTLGLIQHDWTRETAATNLFNWLETH